MSVCAVSENAVEVLVTENATEVVTENSIEVGTENAIEEVTDNAIETVTENAIEVVTDNAIDTITENVIEVVSEIEIEVASENVINAIPDNSIEWMKPKKRKILRKLLPARKPQNLVGISYDSKYILNHHFKGRKSEKKFTFLNRELFDLRTEVRGDFDIHGTKNF